LQNNKKELFPREGAFNLKNLFKPPNLCFDLFFHLLIQTRRRPLKRTAENIVFFSFGILGTNFVFDLFGLLASSFSSSSV